MHEVNPVNQQRALLALAVTAALAVLPGCDAAKAPAPNTGQAAGQAAAPAKATPADADAFVARINEEYKRDYPEAAAAQWVSVTYINADTQLLAAKANERVLAKLGRDIEEAKKFEGLQLKPETARSIQLLKLATSMPAPKDPKKLEELTQLATRMEGMYGAGQYCTGEGEAKKCRPLGELEDTLRS